MEEKNCENQELEIDLIELCRELKNHIALIIAATVIFQQSNLLRRSQQTHYI